MNFLFLNNAGLVIFETKLLRFRAKPNASQYYAKFPAVFFFEILRLKRQMKTVIVNFNSHQEK